MTNTNFSQFRNHAKEYFDLIDQGEIVEINRYGKPCALLIPISKKVSLAAQKPLYISGISLSKSILIERSEQK